MTNLNKITKNSTTKIPPKCWACRKPLEELQVFCLVCKKFQGYRKWTGGIRIEGIIVIIIPLLLSDFLGYREISKSNNEINKSNIGIASYKLSSKDKFEEYMTTSGNATGTNFNNLEKELLRKINIQKPNDTIQPIIKEFQYYRKKDQDPIFVSNGEYFDALSSKFTLRKGSGIKVDANFYVRIDPKRNVKDPNFRYEDLKTTDGAIILEIWPVGNRNNSIIVPGDPLDYGQETKEQYQFLPKNISTPSRFWRFDNESLKGLLGNKDEVEIEIKFRADLKTSDSERFALMSGIGTSYTVTEILPDN